MAPDTQRLIIAHDERLLSLLFVFFRLPCGLHSCACNQWVYFSSSHHHCCRAGEGELGETDMYAILHPIQQEWYMYM